MRAWAVVGLVALLAWAAPGATGQGGGCATLNPAPGSHPFQVSTIKPVTLDLRHSRPNSCLDTTPGCTDGGTRVTFSSTPKAGVSVRYSQNPVTAAPAGGGMEARTTATVSVDARIANSTVFPLEFSAGCGAHQAKRAYQFVTPPYVVVNVTAAITRATPEELAWKLTLVNAGPSQAFVDFVPHPKADWITWHGTGHAAVVGRPEDGPEKPFRAEVLVSANTTRRDTPLLLFLHIGDNPNGEGTENRTLALFEPGGFQGRARLPGAPVPHLVAALAVAVLLVSRQGPAKRLRR